MKPTKTRTKQAVKTYAHMPHQKPKRVRHQKEEINMQKQSDEDKKNERLFDFLEFLVVATFIILLYIFR